MGSKDQNEIVIHPNRVVAIISVIGCLWFVVIGIVIMPQSALAGWACILFFGGCGCVYFKMVVPNKPLLIINDNGIYHKEIGLIEWEYITEVRTYQVLSNNLNMSYFSVNIKSPYMNKLSISRQTKSLLGGPGLVNIPEHLFEVSINDLARMIHLNYGVNIRLGAPD